jgi:hypothetical protein
VELAIEKGTGLAAEKSVLAIEKGSAQGSGNVKMGKVVLNRQIAFLLPRLQSTRRFLPTC